jgi:HK97 family phage major capsid protein
MTMSIEQIKAELENGLKVVDQKISATFAAHDKKLEETGNLTKEMLAQVSSLDSEYKKLAAELIAVQQKSDKKDVKETAVSFGASFVHSESFKAFKEGRSTKAAHTFQANTILGEGGSPQNPTNDIVPLQTLPGIVGGAFRALRVLDVVPGGQATGNTVHYTRETSWTNDAAETAEGGTKPESDLVFEGVDVPVRTIAHFIKVSKQVLDDAPMLESYINIRLTHGLRQRLEYQVINGNGTAPNISGILGSGNYTAVTAGTTDNDFDFANRLKYEVVASDYAPSVYMINPEDWGRMERKKVGTGDDRYVGADGAISYLNNGLTPMLWGLPVVASNNVPAGTLICAASDAMMFFERQGVTIEMFEQDGDNVQKNLITIRGEMRGAFAVFRPAAICAGTLPDA